MISNHFGFNTQIRTTTSAGPTGLVLFLDASNVSSYPGSGSLWKDLSGNSNNSTLSSGVTFNSANSGSLVFTQGTTSGSFNNPVSIPSGNSAYSTVTWVKFTDNTQVSGWLGWGTNGTNQDNGYRFTPEVGKKLQNYAFGSNDFTTNFTPANSTWYFIAYTYDPVAATSNLYLRGGSTVDNSKTLQAALNVTPTTNLKIGTDPIGNPMGGNLAYIQIYNTTLTSTQATDIYNNTRLKFGYLS